MVNLNETLNPKVYTWLCGVFAALGSVIFGYDLGIIASVLPSTSFSSVMGPRFQDPDQQGLVASLFLLGGFFGSVPAGILSDMIGRRRAIQAASLLYMFGGALQTGAKSLGMMQCGRFFAGLGVGPLVLLAPMYQSEIAHPSIRGRLITLQQFMLGVGALGASFIGYGTFTGYHGEDPAYAWDDRSWRISLGIQIIPAIPLFLLIMFFPESPRWLAAQGRHEEATAVLAQLHARGKLDDPFVVNQMQDIITQLETEKAIGSSSWKELFFVPANFRRVSLGVILQFSVQMTGVSVLQYYSPAIFKTMGFSNSRTLLLQSCNSIIALIGEGFCIWFIDRLGRRPPLIVCNILCGCAFAVGTALMAEYPAESNNDAAHWVFVFTTWFYNLFFSFAIGPLSWAYPAETNSNRMRGKATGVTSAFSWISNFMIAQVTPHAFDAIGWKYYLVFAICSFTNAFTMWLLFPEVTGRRLEEMDDLFAVHSWRDWIVPLNPPQKLDRFAAEKDLREGTFVPGKIVEAAEGLPTHTQEGLERAQSQMSSEYDTKSAGGEEQKIG